MQAMFQKQLPIITIAHQTNVVAVAEERSTGIWEDPARHDAASRARSARDDRLRPKEGTGTE